MLYPTFGSTGLKVSVLAQRCMRFNQDRPDLAVQIGE